MHDMLVCQYMALEAAKHWEVAIFQRKTSGFEAFYGLRERVAIRGYHGGILF